MKPANLWKPTSKDFIQYPYDAYREIRKMNEVFKANTGDFVIMGYQDCKHILQDTSFKAGLRLSWIEKMVAESALRNISLHHIQEAVSGMLVQINPPKHHKIRSSLAKNWPAGEELKELAEEITKQVILELPPKFDAMRHICRRIPLRVISKLLGLPAEEVEKYATDGINLAQILGSYLSYRDITSISESTKKLQSFLKACIFSNTYIPTKITEHLFKEYPEDEIINLLLFLFIAGYETTSSLLAICVYHLIKNKDHLLNIEKYGAKPFIDEMLRLNSPVQITGRTNTKPIELSGQYIPEKSALTLCIGAANVDPSQFDQPEKLIWDRPKREHLSFGYGIHFCLGNQLAEIEAEVLIEELFSNIERLRIVNEPVLRNIFTLKSYQSFELAYK